MGEDDNSVNTTHHVVVLELAGGSDGVKHAVVDDCVHGERHTVRGENLLWRDLKHTSPRVNPANLGTNTG